MNDRHYVGPVGKILGEVKRQTSDPTCGDDTPEAGMHALITRRIAAYWAARSAGFQLRRFVTLSGYTPEYADALARELWEELPEKSRRTLLKQEGILHIAHGWWRV